MTTPPKPKSPLPWELVTYEDGHYAVLADHGRQLVMKRQAGSFFRVPEYEDAAFMVHAANSWNELEYYLEGPKELAHGLAVNRIIDAINNANLSIADIDRIEAALKGQIP